MTPQAFWKSSASGALRTLVTSAVRCSLTRATLMIPGKDETRIYMHIYNRVYIYIYHKYIYIYIYIYISEVTIISWI